STSPCRSPGPHLLVPDLSRASPSLPPRPHHRPPSRPAPRGRQPGAAVPPPPPADRARGRLGPRAALPGAVRVDEPGGPPVRAPGAARLSPSPGSVRGDARHLPIDVRPVDVPVSDQPPPPRRRRSREDPVFCQPLPDGSDVPGQRGDVHPHHVRL